MKSRTEYLADHFMNACNLTAEDLREMGIPETDADLAALLNDPNPKNLKHYLKIVEDEMVLINNRTKNYSNEFAIVGDKARDHLLTDIDIITYFAEGVDQLNEAIKTNFMAKTNLIEIVQIDEVKAGLLAMQDNYYTNYKTIEEAKMRSSLPGKAHNVSGVKLNRVNQKATLSNFKEAGVYAYGPEKLAKRTGRGEGKGASVKVSYYKIKDTEVIRTGIDRINARVDFNIPAEQKQYIAQLSNSGVLERSVQEEKMISLESQVLSLRDARAPRVMINQLKGQVNALMPSLVKNFSRLERQENILTTTQVSKVEERKRKRIDEYFSKK